MSSATVPENNKKSISSISVCNEKPSLSFDDGLIPLKQQQNSSLDANTTSTECVYNTDNEGDAGFPSTDYGIQLRNIETVCDTNKLNKQRASCGTESALYSAVPTYDWVFGDHVGADGGVNKGTAESETNCDRQMCTKKHKRSGSAFAALGYYGSGKVKPAAGYHRRTLSNITTTGSVYNPTVVMVVMNNSASNKEIDRPKSYTKMILEHCKVCFCYLFYVNRRK